MTETTVLAARRAAVDDMAEKLDIPPSKYRTAVDRYQAVGAWLDSSDSPLRAHGPNIFPQGSFRLGTVVRPIREGKESDFDIDLVCELTQRIGDIEPSRLKSIVGDRLREHGTYARLLDSEGRRCWTLLYAETDGVGFHLDCLPAASADLLSKAALENRGVLSERAASAIRITDFDRRTSQHSWVDGGTNPSGYASWFDDVNREAASREIPTQRQRLFEKNRGLYDSVADVPDGLIRTPLQRAIQILKRHRDVRFVGHEWEDQKPISMILTTLSAKAYNGEVDTIEALRAILDRLESYETSEVIDRTGGVWNVPNPVNPAENFADRWNDPESHRADAFFEWLSWLRQDLSLLDDTSNHEDASKVLNEALAVEHAGSASSGAIVPATESVPELGNASHRQTPPWRVERTGRVRVVGSVRSTRNSSKERWRLSSRPVPKGMWIRFKANVNVAGPYRVVWQIVNTGPEAHAAGTRELRGGFDEGDGRNGEVRWETASFHGTHTIEAFVVQDNVCIARSGVVHVRVRA